MRIAQEHKRRRRVWSETLELGPLSEPSLLRKLADRNIDLLVALFPGQTAGLSRLLAAAAEHGAHVGAWPMLGDAVGRWANLQTASAFAEHGHALLDEAAASGHAFSSFVFDLEPPLARVRAAIEGHRSALWGPAGLSSAPLVELRGRLRNENIETLAAIVPMVATDPVGRSGWQRLLGTPVDEVDPDTTTAMLYSSLIAGYSRGLIGPRQATALVHQFALACKRRFGARASASLGAVGPGALGDERALEGPDALAQDVAACEAAGLHDLALFELGAVLRRDPTDAWFDALCCPGTYARPTLAHELCARGLERVSHGLGWLLAHTNSRRGRSLPF